MSGNLQILKTDYLEDFVAKADIDWRKTSGRFRAKRNFLQEDFLFYLQSSALIPQILKVIRLI
jgi:hypothetical protein